MANHARCARHDLQKPKTGLRKAIYVDTRRIRRESRPPFGNVAVRRFSSRRGNASTTLPQASGPALLLWLQATNLRKLPPSRRLLEHRGRAPRQDRTVRGPPRRSATHRPRRTAGIVAAARRSRPAGRPWVRTATQGPRSAGGLDRGDPTRAARSSWHAPPPKVVRRSRPPLRAKVDKRGLRGGMSEPREDRIPRSHDTTLPGDTCTLRVMSRSRAAASALASHRRLATAPWRR